MYHLSVRASPLALVVLFLGAGEVLAGESPAGPIVLHERTPLAFLLGTPTGEVANTSSSEIIRLVSELLEAHTNFFLQVVEAQVAVDCKGRLACVVRQIRGEDNRVYSKYLLLLSNITVEGEADRLTAMLIDTDVALEYARDARADKDWERDAESRINEYAVVLRPVRSEVADVAATRAFLERLFREHLARVFGESGSWEPYGAIEIASSLDGVTISLDGMPIGATRPEKTTIENVTAGRRRLLLERPGYAPFETEVEVQRGATASVDAVLTREGEGSAPLVRSLTFWTGVGFAVAGSALAGASILKSDGGAELSCFAVPGSECRTGSQFKSLGYDPNARAGEDVNPSGVLLAPLGYSIALTGAVWAGGIALFGDDADMPWVQLAAGLVAGSLAYGLSAIFDAPHR